MLSNHLPAILLFAFSFILSACHDPHHDHSRYEYTYIEPGETRIIRYPFDSYETYRIELFTYSGDVDLAIYNEHDELVVFSDEYSTDLDWVVFTAGNYNYEIEIYGNYGSEYELTVERLPYDYIGLETAVDGIEFIIDRDSFTGDIFSVLEFKSFWVSHAYDVLTVIPDPDPVWLDVTPTGSFYGSLNNNSVDISVNILETDSPGKNNFASVFVQAEDYLGKVNVFKEVDIIYRVIN